MHARVLIASPVRNRAWILPEFLAALERLEFCAQHTAYHFLVNDCVDASPAILRSWTAGRPGAAVEQLDTGVAGWNRYRWPHYDYANLAFLRNHILDRFLEGSATHLFSVDSDVIVPPHALAELLAAAKPVVAGVIANLPGFSVEDSPAHNFLFRSGGFYRHERAVPDGVFEVDLMGAVALIRRDVIEAGVRFEGRRSGEDIGFCEQAKEMGFGLWCHGGVRCEHRMDDPAQPRPAPHPMERLIGWEPAAAGARPPHLQQPAPWRQPRWGGRGGYSSGRTPPGWSPRIWTGRDGPAGPGSARPAGR